MSSAREEWVVTGAMAMTLRLLKFHGVAPLRFKSSPDGTLVYISRPLYILNVIFTLIIISVILYATFSIVKYEDVKREQTTGTTIIYISNFMLCIFTISLANVYGVVRMKCFLNSMTYINKIKRDVNVEFLPNNNKKHIITSIIIISWLVMMWMTGMTRVVILNTLKKSTSCIIALVNYFVYGGLFLMEMQFALVARTISSVFKDVNEQLRRSLLQLKLETKSDDDRILMKSKNNGIYSDLRIPITDIQAINGMGQILHVFQSMRKNPRLKLASKIHGLKHNFVSICAVIRNLNGVENMFLFFHIVASILHFVVSISTLYTKNEDYNLALIIIHIIWFCSYITKPIWLIEPCQQTYDETFITIYKLFLIALHLKEFTVSALLLAFIAFLTTYDISLSEMKMLVAKITSFVNSESDPLLSATDAFFQQLILNEIAYSAMDICSIDRRAFSAIAGAAITVLLMFSQS